jgi:type I restriction-modification system DNA methylase subunit
LGRSTVHYADDKTNQILKKLHNKLRPAGTPVQRVEYILELLLLRIFEVKLKKDEEFADIRELFSGEEEGKRLFYYLQTIDSKKITEELNKNFFPFYSKILIEAQKVIKGNLSAKVQDQLVLIQEVFGRSSFTDNVQSGNLSEIIGAVADLDEDRLISTDLLGDAIEASLSETGGTKDIGLYRTPDHVRQFMVGLVEPSMNDTIFDPACGTGGFLFDSYEYVMERILRDGNWPGIKAHPELAEWFGNFFINNPSEMPSIDVANHFYRNGVSGIEYLGVIKKMAAVNFYIRGLNPSNIKQGDSLALFNSSVAGTKSIVIANPPFGAERDQEAYPNVWQDYSKESETTILFVKLMLDSLRPGGKCAVIVSEGFLTWGQNSARELRKKLLDETNLVGVIGLPQGVFVSKSGQGPKTSILLYEKGKQTEKVWFYQVQNDGYTSGANRTAREGCQLVDALNTYHNFIKKGLTPPDKKNSFVLSVDWLKSVDPRIKIKIKQTVTEEYTAKYLAKKNKLEASLMSKVEQGKLSKADVNQKLTQLKITWKSKISNEISKQIDKAYAFSFNAGSYKSSVSDSQLEQWNKLVGEVNTDDSSAMLDDRYNQLVKSGYDTAFELLRKFDITNAIEYDIVREYTANLSVDILASHPELKAIDDIFKSGAKYPKVKIKDVCDFFKGTSPIMKTPDGPYPLVVTAEERKTSDEYQFDGKAVCIPLISSSGHGKASLNRIHYQEGKFALANLLFALFAKDENVLNMKYLYYMLSARLDVLLVPLMKGTANVGMKMEDVVEVEFPLPSIEIQDELVVKLDKINTVIKSINELAENVIYKFDLGNENRVDLGDERYFKIESGGTPSSHVEKYWGGDINWVTLIDLPQNDYVTKIYSTKRTITVEGLKKSSAKILPPNTILLSSRATIGRVAIAMTELATNQGFKNIIIKDWPIVK